ncbi:MAG: formate/nitrite transporter family protein [Clostridia bacterium]|nr:formate/nitrite transporter family protein [Clostridia bacterium]
MRKKGTSIFVDGILSGVFLCIGCMVNLLTESKLAGAFLFSLGLFAIITFRLALYTGKAGYMAVKPASYIGEVALTLAGNAAGTALGGFLLNLTRFGGELSQKAATVMAAKTADSPVSMFLLAVFCGMLMFTAVHGEKCNREKGNIVGALFIVVLPVMVFILCGFNHCVADMAYFFISGCAHCGAAGLYFVLAILGNAVGCMLIPLAKKLSENKI